MQKPIHVLLIMALAKAKGKDKAELNRWLSSRARSSEKVKAVTAIYDKLGISDSTEEKINSYFSRGFAQLKKLKVAEHRKSPLYEFTLQLIDRIS